MTGTGAVPPWLRRIGIEVLGWVLIVVGLAALVLPGPGLLALAAGLVVLSLQYAWAKRLLASIRTLAFRSAAKEVRTWPRIIAGTLSGLAVVSAGILWGIRPPAPEWWALGDHWWLPGGWGTGAALIVSGLTALALIVYSFRKFRRPRTGAHRRPGT
ncbi:PGPGW domain-containing protein [Arthrobacter sp. GCM10027362]|uniref:PGPGW domain-containing protein n=1 Tax=Arthrobacter sp. GCM10027362 TaxID=3273379 RepID=UPI003643365E